MGEAVWRILDWLYPFKAVKGLRLGESRFVWSVAVLTDMEKLAVICPPVRMPRMALPGRDAVICASEVIGFFERRRTLPVTIVAHRSRVFSGDSD
jgi:hypothetical protein